MSLTYPDDPDFQQLRWLIAMTAPPSIRPSAAEAERCREALERIHSRMQTAVGLLREVEWQQACGPAGYESFDQCLFCGRERSVGHAPDCSLGALLSRFGRESHP